MTKNVLILTRSDKNGGYCVAGIDLSNGQFIRLVSEDSRTDYALTLADITYEDKSVMAPMDKIAVKVKGIQNSVNQPENYVIDEEYYFAKTGQANIDEVRTYLMRQQYIFYNSSNSVTRYEMQRVLNKYSLILFKVDELNLWRDKYHDDRITASFVYNGEEYKYIKITDSELTQKYYDTVCQYHPRPYTIYYPMLIMSLAGATYQGKYYKLIANIIEDNVGTFEADI